MNRNEIQESMQESMTEFRNNLENSIREMLKSLPVDALKNVKVGLDGVPGLGENFMSNLNTKIQDIINASLELAKQAVENGAEGSSEQGEPESHVTTHTVINGKTIE
ncbi:UNVERIFIED_CONTAM: bacterioferritin (cytochrome b1) [Brevibacillus sp. OAP136]